MFLLIRSNVQILLMSTAIILLSWKDASAYIDPGTGSMIIQAVIGAIVPIIAITEPRAARYEAACPRGANLMLILLLAK